MVRHPQKATKSTGKLLMLLMLLWLHQQLYHRQRQPATACLVALPAAKHWQYTLLNFDKTAKSGVDVGHSIQCCRPCKPCWQQCQELAGNRQYHFCWINDIYVPSQLCSSVITLISAEMCAGAPKASLPWSFRESTLQSSPRHSIYKPAVKPRDSNSKSVVEVMVRCSGHLHATSLHLRYGVFCASNSGSTFCVVC